MAFRDIEGLVDALLSGDGRALARAATFVEAQAKAGKEVISRVFSRAGRALTVGVTGPPGAGKSTLVNVLTRELRANGKTVGIIAVDPSSPFSQGAILGDRVRMTEHHGDGGVFIRSMATRGSLGGLAPAALELMILMDAAGRDVIFVETVGVGQDEVAVAQLADATAVVLTPGMGDDIQAAKAGIMEIADVFVINKADLPGADRLESEIKIVQKLGGEELRSDQAPIYKVVSIDGAGIPALWKGIEAIGKQRGRKVLSGDFWVAQLSIMTARALQARLPEEIVRQYAEQVAERMRDPYSARDEILMRANVRD